MKYLYQLLFRKYLKVIGCAFVLAIPLAYYLLYMYTRDFVLKIPVDIGIYLAVLAIISFISSSTLIWQKMCIRDSSTAAYLFALPMNRESLSCANMEQEMTINNNKMCIRDRPRYGEGKLSDESDWKFIQSGY